MQINLSPQRAQRTQSAAATFALRYGVAPQRIRTRMTRIGRRDTKVVSQIAEYATPSIWGNPTVTYVGSNAEVWSLQDNMEMLEVLPNQSVRIRIP